MTTVPCVQILKDVSEKVSSVSLSQDLSTGAYIIVMRFQHLASLAHFLCARRRSNNVLHLTDSEGKILVRPSINMIYEGSQEQYLRSVECKFEIYQDKLWKRFIRFVDRYAEANSLFEKEAEIDHSSDSRPILYLENCSLESYKKLKALPSST